MQHAYLGMEVLQPLRNLGLVNVVQRFWGRSLRDVCRFRRMLGRCLGGLGKEKKHAKNKWNQRKNIKQTINTCKNLCFLSGLVSISDRDFVQVQIVTDLRAHLGLCEAPSRVRQEVRVVQG